MKYIYSGPPTGMSITVNGVIRETLLFPGQTVELSPQDNYTLSLLAGGFLMSTLSGGDEVSSQEPVPAQGGETPPVKDETLQPDNTQLPGACCPKTPEYYYVIPVAGQSNMMAYGEGLPLPDTLDAPHPRIKQLARRSTVTPGVVACQYNDIIPLDHCPHDVQNMSTLNHPHADLSKGQYGCVGQALHIAKKLLPYLPEEAGILMVPCSRGGAAFTQGADGAFNAASGATEASARWGVGKPLYQDLIIRTKAALDRNPKNQLLAVVWMQGEFDMSSASYAQQPALFAAMVKQFRTDLVDHAAQMPDFKADSVPWICGDTTYYWKNTYPTQYDMVYGGYKTCQEPNVFFVPFLTDENGHNTPTNEPSQDLDIPAAHYYGSASRTSANWVSSLRGSHFSSWARRDIIPTRLTSAILLYAGRKSLLVASSGSALPATATGCCSRDGAQFPGLPSHRK